MQPAGNLTKAEILRCCDWKEAWFGRFQCHSNLFGHSVEIHILVESDREISDRSVAIVNDFLKLDAASLAEMKRFLWQGCVECCEDSDYGFDVRDGQSMTEANHEGFGVFNAEDAYQKSRLMYLLIDEEDQNLKGNYGLIHFDNEWESHISVVVMKDGRIVGHGQSGLYVGEYDST